MTLDGILTMIIGLASLPPVTAIIGIIVSVIKQKKCNEATCKEVKETVESVRDEIVKTKEYTELKEQLVIVHKENAELKQKLNELLTKIDKVNRDE